MKEEQFMKIPSQGNIYSTTRLGNLVLLGSGKHGKVFAYTNPKALEQVPLSDIPNNGVSIEGLYAMNDGPFSTLGVTFVHTTFNGIEETKTSYFNIYSGKWNMGQNTILEKIGNRKCSKFKLSYFPYHITSATITKPDNSEESVFLLSGSDLKIHTFAESEDGERFIEVTTKDYFPELSGYFPAIVTQIQLLCLTPMRKRITITGCENGTILAFIVHDTAEVRAQSPTPSLDSISSDKRDMESSLSEKDFGGGDSGDFTRLASSMNENLNFGDSVYRYTAHFDGMINAVRFYKDGFSLNAVVASAKSPTYVYTNILDDKFAVGRCLKFSSRWDAVESICVDDIDSDGRPEIIIGTFGCTMLVYKFVLEIKQWVIVAHQKFPSGILTIDYLDGSLYTVTSSGLHIIEYREVDSQSLDLNLPVLNTPTSQEATFIPVKL